jgi:hypothetical protein
MTRVLLWSLLGVLALMFSYFSEILFYYYFQRYLRSHILSTSSLLRFSKLTYLQHFVPFIVPFTKKKVFFPKYGSHLTTRH